MTLTLSQRSPCFYVSAVQIFENTVGLGEIAHYKQFLLFIVFSSLMENFPTFSLNLKLSSANYFSLEESKISCLGKGQTTLKKISFENIAGEGEI